MNSNFHEHEFYDHEKVQHKAVITPLVYGFADGEAVPITWPEEISPPEQLLLALRQMELSDTVAVLGEIQTCIDKEIDTRLHDLVDQRAADLIANVVHRLGIKSPEGIALRIAICGLDRSYESYREAANGAGISHVGLWKKVKNILKKLTSS